MKAYFIKLKETFEKFDKNQKIASIVLALSIVLCLGFRVSAMSNVIETSAAESKNEISSFVSSLFETSSFEQTSITTSSNGKNIPITLKPSSVEEDLEIQILNEKGELVKGPNFKITVKGEKNGYNKEWTVNDGFLKLTKLPSGDYVVTIAEMEGYSVPKEPLKCKVEKKVKYQKVDVSDKLVDDSKVDSSKEDAGYTPVKPPAPAPRPKDTVEFVESSTKMVKKKIKTSVTMYKPILMDDGTMKNNAGVSSGLYPVYDDEGYLKGAYKLESYPVSQSGLLSVMPLHNTKSLWGLLNTVTLLDENSMTTIDESVNTTPSTNSEETVIPPASSEQPTPPPASSEQPTPPASSEQPTPPPASSEQPTPPPASSDDSSSIVPTPTPKPEKVNVDIFDGEGKPIKDAQGNTLVALQEVKVEKEVEKEVLVRYGWQTVDGEKCYYDKNGEKVTGTQVIQGVTYHFGSDGKNNTVLGIDVSKYQGNIDWKAVKDSGIEFAIIRVGYRGYGTGVLVEDPYFRKNIQGATQAGLKVGVYVFSQAITAEEAVEEASMCLSAVSGYKLALPIFFDSEYSTSRKTGRADGLSKSHRTTIAKAFCETVQNGGYRAGVYASSSWFYHQLEYSQISPYDIWVARYGVDKLDFKHHYDIWQYTGSGTCAGVGGAVDMNIAYKSY